jgi:hypothetical protein
MKDMRKDILEGLHNLELKFQTILSQWLFGGGYACKSDNFYLSHSIANVLSLDCWSCAHFGRCLSFPRNEGVGTSHGQGEESYRREGAGQA